MTQQIPVFTKSSAPGPYLGYAIQPVRALYYLLTAPDGADVSIELVDDVTVHSADGSMIVEQDKSVTGPQNPVSDWCAELWKTFSNWIEMIESGSVDVTHTKFRLFVVPSRLGKLVTRLSAATDESAITALLKEIKGKLKSKKHPPSCDEHLQRLLNAQQSTSTALIRSFTFESLPCPLEPIRAILKATIPDNLIELILDYAIGAAKAEIDERLRAKKPAKINAKEFRQKLHAFIRKHDLTKLLVSLSGTPSSAQIESVLSQAPFFVRQLDVIGLNDGERFSAISDYLQSAADKTDWAENGYVVADSFCEFDAGLVKRHGFISAEVKDTQADKDVQAQGRILYSRCCQVQMKLEAREVPSHFIPGSYNHLADDLRLGWHPHYQDIFKSDE